MSGPAVFDLRIPLGYLFAVLGVLLIVASFTAAAEADARSLGIEIDLIWGAVMIVFGTLCLLLARRKAKRRRG